MLHPAGDAGEHAREPEPEHDSDQHPHMRKNVEAAHQSAPYLHWRATGSRTGTPMFSSRDQARRRRDQISAARLLIKAATAISMEGSRTSTSDSERAHC